MSSTLQEAIEAIRPFISKTHIAKPSDVIKSLSGRFKGVLKKGQSSTKIIRALRNSNYGRI